MDKLVPAATLDDQEAIMQGTHEPIRLGSAPFSSYDPQTDAKKMLPLEDGTSAHQAAQEAAEIREGDGSGLNDYKGMKVDDLKNLVAERGLTAESNKKDDLRAALMAADAEELNSRDFIDAIKAAETEEELTAAWDVYEASGNEYVSVVNAYNNRLDELNQ